MMGKHKKDVVPSDISLNRCVDIVNRCSKRIGQICFAANTPYHVSVANEAGRVAEGEVDPSSGMQTPVRSRRNSTHASSSSRVMSPSSARSPYSVTKREQARIMNIELSKHMIEPVMSYIALRQEEQERRDAGASMEETRAHLDDPAYDLYYALGCMHRWLIEDDGAPETNEQQELQNIDDNQNPGGLSATQRKKGEESIIKMLVDERDVPRYAYSTLLDLIGRVGLLTKEFFPFDCYTVEARRELFMQSDDGRKPGPPPGVEAGIEHCEPLMEAIRPPELDVAAIASVFEAVEDPYASPKSDGDGYGSPTEGHYRSVYDAIPKGMVRRHQIHVTGLLQVWARALTTYFLHCELLMQLEAGRKEQLSLQAQQAEAERKRKEQEEADRLLRERNAEEERQRKEQEEADRLLREKNAEVERQRQKEQEEADRLLRERNAEATRAMDRANLEAGEGTIRSLIEGELKKLFEHLLEIEENERQLHFTAAVSAARAKMQREMAAQQEERNRLAAEKALQEEARRLVLVRLSRLEGEELEDRGDVELDEAKRRKKAILKFADEIDELEAIEAEGRKKLTAQLIKRQQEEEAEEERRRQQQELDDSWAREAEKTEQERHKRMKAHRAQLDEQAEREAAEAKHIQERLEEQRRVKAALLRLDHISQVLEEVASKEEPLHRRVIEVDEEALERRHLNSIFTMQRRDIAERETAQRVEEERLKRLAGQKENERRILEEQRQRELDLEAAEAEEELARQRQRTKRRKAIEDEDRQRADELAKLFEKERSAVEFGAVAAGLPQYNEIGEYPARNALLLEEVEGRRRLKLLFHDQVADVAAAQEERYRREEEEAREAASRRKKAIMLDREERDMEERAKKLAEAEARRRQLEAEAEAEAQRRANEAEARRLAAEAEAKRRADEAEARRLAAEEEANRLEEELEVRRKAVKRASEEARQRQLEAEEEARRVAEAKKLAAEVEARRRTEEEARRRAEEEAAVRRRKELLRQEEEEIARRKAAERRRRELEEEIARRLKEEQEEAARKASEEAERKRKEEDAWAEEQENQRRAKATRPVKVVEYSDDLMTRLGMLERENRFLCRVVDGINYNQTALHEHVLVTDEAHQGQISAILSQATTPRAISAPEPLLLLPAPPATSDVSAYSDPPDLFSIPRATRQEEVAIEVGQTSAEEVTAPQVEEEELSPIPATKERMDEDRDPENRALASTQPPTPREETLPPQPRAKMANPLTSLRQKLAELTGSTPETDTPNRAVVDKAPTQDASGVRVYSGIADRIRRQVQQGSAYHSTTLTPSAPPKAAPPSPSQQQQREDPPLALLLQKRAQARQQAVEQQESPKPLVVPVMASAPFPSSDPSSSPSPYQKLSPFPVQHNTQRELLTVDEDSDDDGVIDLTGAPNVTVPAPIIHRELPREAKVAPRPTSARMRGAAAPSSQRAAYGLNADMPTLAAKPQKAPFQAEQERRELEQKRKLATLAKRHPRAFARAPDGLGGWNMFDAEMRRGGAGGGAVMPWMNPRELERNREDHLKQIQDELADADNHDSYNANIMNHGTKKLVAGAVDHATTDELEEARERQEYEIDVVQQLIRELRHRCGLTSGGTQHPATEDDDMLLLPTPCIKLDFSLMAPWITDQHFKLILHAILDAADTLPPRTQFYSNRTQIVTLGPRSTTFAHPGAYSGVLAVSRPTPEDQERNVAATLRIIDITRCRYVKSSLVIEMLAEIVNKCPMMCHVLYDHRNFPVNHHFVNEKVRAGEAEDDSATGYGNADFSSPERVSPYSRRSHSPRGRDPYADPHPMTTTLLSPTKVAPNPLEVAITNRINEIRDLNRPLVHSSGVAPSRDQIKYAVEDATPPQSMKRRPLSAGLGGRRMLSGAAM